MTIALKINNSLSSNEELGLFVIYFPSTTPSHQDKRTSDSIVWLCAKHKLVEVLYFLAYVSTLHKKYFSTFYLLKKIEYSL
jgi:hypothetical protein